MTILKVSYGDGMIEDQLFSLKLSTIIQHEIPVIWKMEEDLLDLLLHMNHGRWPQQLFTEHHILNLPVDITSTLSCLFTEDGMWPFIPILPEIINVRE